MGGTLLSVVTRGDTGRRSRRHQLVEGGCYSADRVLKWDAGKKDHFSENCIDYQGGQQRLPGDWPHGSGLEYGYQNLEPTIHCGKSRFMTFCIDFGQAIGRVQR